MDGNRRWARARGLADAAGHRAGADTMIEILRACGQRGVRWATVYALSTENWKKRSAAEVAALMALIGECCERLIADETAPRLQPIGDWQALPGTVVAALQRAVAATAHRTGTTLLLALNYGGRDELLRATRAAVAAGRAPHTEADMDALLDTAGVPAPELMVRTGGQRRLSGFLLWQCAYSELYFTDVMWPDFTPEQLDAALAWYAEQLRNFGK